MLIVQEHNSRLYQKGIKASLLKFIITINHGKAIYYVNSDLYV